MPKAIGSIVRSLVRVPEPLASEELVDVFQGLSVSGTGLQEFTMEYCGELVDKIGAGVLLEGQ